MSSHPLFQPHDPTEKQLALLRPHWFVIAPILLGFILILALPFAAWFILQTFHPGFFAVQAYVVLYVLAASMFFLFAWLFLFQAFMDYFLDIWVITTYRLIDIQQHGLFGRTTSELTLDHIQDVTSEVKGFMRTFFDYGMVYVQTAGERERFTFEDIPHPARLAKRLLALAHERRQKTE